MPQVHDLLEMFHVQFNNLIKTIIQNRIYWVKLGNSVYVSRIKNCDILSRYDAQHDDINTVWTIKHSHLLITNRQCLNVELCLPQTGGTNWTVHCLIWQQMLFNEHQSPA